MKVSIITVCFNSSKTIESTLNSVLTQSYKNIEHLIIDGKSTDGTVEILKNYPFKNKKIISEKDNGLYDAINKGLKLATGEIIAILNSDDIYHSYLTIEKIVDEINKYKNVNVFLSNVVFFSGKKFSKITRFYSSYNFKKWTFKYGFMPPHPGVFLRRELITKYNLKYNNSLSIAADFDFLCNIIKKRNIRYKVIKITSVRMMTGGISGRNILAYLISTYEILKSLKDNNIQSNIFNVLLRIPSKIKQFYLFNSNSLNKDFKLKVSKNYFNYFSNKFVILKSIKKLDLNKNFILSGMNLAFLGYYSKGDIKNYPDLIHWPDGFFSKLYGKNIKKIPGREILRKLKLNKSIKKIIVYGNISKKGKLYLNHRFKLPIAQINLPFANISKILKKVDIKTSKKELILITLPTPKQEIIAEKISKLNKNYRIICIGASINIACGEEKQVPLLLKNFEFIWRLRYETKRRFKRLIETFIYYAYGKFITKRLSNIEIETL